MQADFRRVAIVNRGEAAMRFIHAAREFNREQGAVLRTLALYTDPDRHAMFVREADESFSLGPAQVLDPNTRLTKSSYLDYGLLERVLAAARADAVWAGWGFVAEHAEFADLCRDLGIVFIGPDGAVMRQLGDKITSKLLAEKAGIAVAPWSHGAVDTRRDARRHAERLGFPLMIKATAGGGGHGIRRVNSPDELVKALEGARAEAFKTFGNPTVFMERVIPNARHIEVQIMADQHGNSWAVGVRDCTIQRRNQKILEEAPSPALTPQEDCTLREAAVRLSRSVGYHNAGTVEFLFEPATRQFSFMEMNTRLQVEHPITEATTGLDLVKLQIHVARGARLEGEAPRTFGHAIEVRLNAEDPDNGFAPAPGIVERFRILAGAGVRVDTGVAEGDTVPAEFDSMIAKVIAHGRNREEALSRLYRALRESVVVIAGGASNRAFLLELLSRPEVQRGEVDTGWMDRLSATSQHLSRSCADVALLHAAIEAYGAEAAVEQGEFYASAVRGRPHVRLDVGHTVELLYRGNRYSFQVYRLGPMQYRVAGEGSNIEVRIERLSQFEYWLTASGQRFHLVSVVQGLSHRIDVQGASHRIDRGEGGIVRSPSPAVVVSIAVKAGDTVVAGQHLAVLEAMKMEMPVAAPFSGRIRQVLTNAHVQVDAGTPLLQLDPEATAMVATDTNRVSLAALAKPEECGGDVQLSCVRNLEEVRRLMLGLDVDPIQTAGLLTGWTQDDESSEAVRHREDEILNIFVDICSLFLHEPAVGLTTSGQGPSAEAHFFSYLRMLETRGQGLPPEFIEALRRALAHYGVRTLGRSAELEQSLLSICKSHQRMAHHIPPILALLERRLNRVQNLPPQVRESFRKLLGKIISITHAEFPAVSDLAGEVRYRYFDQPLLEEARREVFARAEEDLDCLAADPKAIGVRDRLRALVDCPQPLTGLFSARFASAKPASRRLMLEVLTLRYYRIRNLQNLRSFEIGEHCCLAAQYDHKGKHIHLFAALVNYSDLADAARGLRPLLQEVPDGQEVVVDFLTFCPVKPANPDMTELEVRTLLNNAGFPRPIRRINVAVAGPNRLAGNGGMEYFTYRPAVVLDEPAGRVYEEDKFYRGIHPMLGKRLHLWRLENFNLERLPSVEDVYLLHAVARDNPKDERLFACAEVRDLTPVRDEANRIVQLPQLERMFTEALAGIRMFQSRRSRHQRLYWNRILLYLSPPLTLKQEEIDVIIRKLAPATEGLGLEQVVVRARIPNPETGELRDMIVRVSSPAGSGVITTFRPATNLQPLKPLSEYTQEVVRMRQRGLMYPYEIVKMLTPGPDASRTGFPQGDFVEHDLDSHGRLTPVYRDYGENSSNIIAGVIRNFTPRYPEGMSRVLLLSDPGKDLGALAEPECTRIMAALDLAQTERIPLEWFAISAGAKISMKSGVENMDWIARVLRRIVEFTQSGGEVNLVIDGINVGAQPYWNAESTMLMHTRGILIMTPKAAMVLTGKQALDYSGSVSAEDNQGIGGYDRIMGLNGQAQYWAGDIDEACHILLRHYEHAYVAPGERFPRRAATSDPIDRDVREYSLGNDHENGFTRVGEIFSDETNPGRKKSFDIRKVMMAVADQDHAPMERWAGMQSADTSVVWDAHLGGFPVCLIGIESRPVTRLGFVPADGPDQWTAGTLFPLSSKKIARAINAASNNRPVVLLANLSGFDGSPESMRRLQLEYGAEIGRAVVNFQGPMIFCVVSRYHGGAYVVFSRALNENLEVVALEGTYASVIGGAPAAAVVFARDVESRTRNDARLQALSAEAAQAQGAEQRRLRAQWSELFKIVHSEKLGEVADEFDRIHTVQRALQVGALHRIIPPAELRPYLIAAVERGIYKQDKLHREETPELAVLAAHL